MVGAAPMRTLGVLGEPCLRPGLLAKQAVVLLRGAAA